MFSFRNSKANNKNNPPAADKDNNKKPINKDDKNDSMASITNGIRQKILGYNSNNYSKDSDNLIGMDNFDDAEQEQSAFNVNNPGNLSAPEYYNAQYNSINDNEEEEEDTFYNSPNQDWNNEADENDTNSNLSSKDDYQSPWKASINQPSEQQNYDELPQDTNVISVSSQENYNNVPNSNKPSFKETRNQNDNDSLNRYNPTATDSNVYNFDRQNPEQNEAAEDYNKIATDLEEDEANYDDEEEENDYSLSDDESLDNEAEDNDDYTTDEADYENPADNLDNAKDSWSARPSTPRSNYDFNQFPTPSLRQNDEGSERIPTANRSLTNSPYEANAPLDSTYRYDNNLQPPLASNTASPYSNYRSNYEPYNYSNASAYQSPRQNNYETSFQQANPLLTNYDNPSTTSQEMQQMMAVIKSLKDNARSLSHTSIEEFVFNTLDKEIKVWVDANLPSLANKVIAAEIKKIIDGVKEG